MEGSDRRRAALQRRLRRGMRLLLPADPGPAVMLDAVRQISPGAKRILPHRIQVDGRSQFYLSRAYPIDTETRRTAGLPQDVTVAYFLKWVADSAADADRYREQGTGLLAGLADRFGGVCWPSPDGGMTSVAGLDGAQGASAEAESAGVGAGRVGSERRLGPGRSGPGRSGPGRSMLGRLVRSRLVLTVGLLFLCTVVFFGFAADDGTAAKWPQMAVNALTGLVFAAATVLLAWRHPGRR
jgi:hypothetical protein